MENLMTNKSKMNKISELLPGNLSEETLTEIAKLVDGIIKKEVQARTKVLEAKVFAFIRGKVDTLKNQAIAELSEENETFRNAHRFETLKSLMALEIGTSDEESAVGQAVQEATEVQEENEVLVEELTKAVEVNETKETEINILKDKLTKLQEERDQVKAELESANQSRMTLSEDALNEEVSTEDGKKVVVNSSERAILISVSDEVPTPVSEDAVEEAESEFITEAAMRLMPQNDDEYSL